MQPQVFERSLASTNPTYKPLRAHPKGYPLGRNGKVTWVLGYMIEQLIFTFD